MWAAAWPGSPSCRWLWPSPSRARASSGAALRSRAMARAWVGVVPAGLGGVCGPDRELAEAVECLGLAEPVAEISEQGQGLLVASGGGGVVAGLLQHEAQVVEGLGLPGRQIWVGGPGMLHRLGHSCPPPPPKETYAMPAPLADNAITGTGNQAGAPRYPCSGACDPRPRPPQGPGTTAARRSPAARGPAAAASAWDRCQLPRLAVRAAGPGRRRLLPLPEPALLLIAGSLLHPVAEKMTDR